MDKVSLRIAVRQLIASAECKIYKFKNDVIIHDYQQHVDALRRAITASTHNRAERAKLLSLLSQCAPTAFEMACFHDAHYLLRKFEKIKNSIPSLV